MDVQEMTTLLIDNIAGIELGIGLLLIVLYGLLMYLFVKLSRMQKLYEKMMKGRSGESLENALLGFIDETHRVAEENQEMRVKIDAIDALLQKAVTRKAMVRFRAFEDMGSDQSYAVALLDAENNGVVFSSIFAREVSRTYAKPIVKGHSEYALSAEEEQVLKEAMHQR